MKIHSDYLHKHTKDAFDIDADQNLYWMIAEDMLQNAGKFAPRSVWQKLSGATDYRTYEQRRDRYQELVLSDVEMRQHAQENIDIFYNLTLLLDAWVGPRGKREIFDEKMLASYRDYVAGFSSCTQFDNLQTPGIYTMQSDLLTADEIATLNTLMHDRDHLEVLEIGGGYGRLCEGIMNTFSNQTHYVLADSVPLSLMYAYLYLSKNLPDAKVGIYYLDPDHDPSQYDCYVVPTWRLEEIYGKGGAKPFNLAVNIQSMQEMSQWHVDYYLDFFDRFSTDDALFYFYNNKQYIFRGNWNYPACWKLLFRHNTPWSWSNDCPKEVFAKSKTDSRLYNQLVSDAHNDSVIQKANAQQQISQNRELSNQICELSSQNSQMINSKSWRITKPLRLITRIFSKKDK